MCEGGGVSARLGASKRRMLSLADRPSLAEVAAWLGTEPLTGAAEGIVAGRVQLRMAGAEEGLRSDERQYWGRARCNGKDNGGGGQSGGAV